jgi:phospholipid transport system substrate-binding protein
VVALALALLTAPSAAQSTPSQVIDTLSNQVLAVLRDTSLQTDVRRTKIEEIIYRYVDFETLSRLVMARNWTRLSDRQKSEFKTEFKKHLSHTYGDNIDNYRNESVAILAERPEKRGDVTVKSKIIRGGSDDILVDYRLRKREENWRIIDVVIEGVSLVANFRSQFQEIMTSGGAERLLELLREKNLEPPSA